MKLLVQTVLTAFVLILVSSDAEAVNQIQKWTYEAKMPMHAVYPRPDCETEKHARHRWAHTDMPYEIPIGVQGGAWPFTYTLIDAPEGATLGKVLGSDNYGVLSWTPSSDASGSHKFRVRVSDKVGNNTDINWTTTVDNSKFVFIQDGFSGNKKGTISEPLEDISDWYKGDRDDKSFHNKIIVFRGGEYQIIGQEKTNWNIRLDRKTKTPSLIGFPNEEPVISASKGKIFTDVKALPDLFIADLHFTRSRQDFSNAHFFWAIGDVTRATWWRNKFSEHGPGTKGTDNPAGVFISSRGVHKHNILYKDNDHDKFYNGRANGSYVDIYYASHVLIEGNTASNSDNKCGFWAKGTTSFVTIRDNHAYDNVTSGGICVGYGKESPEVPHDHEIAWNRIIFNGEYNRANALLFSEQKSWEDKHYNSYIYRNTFVNGRVWIRFEGKNKYQVDGNVIVTDHSVNKTETKTYHPNLIGTMADFIADDTGDLKGYALDYQGEVGYKL